MKVAFHTLGCKVNSYETQSVWKMFSDAGYQRVEFDELSDVYIINTCTVTNQGDSKSRQYIRQAIKRNPDAVIVVMGCYAQANPDEVMDIAGVDIVIGTNQKEKALELVNKYLNDRKPINNVTSVMKLHDFDNLEAFEYEHTRAFLKIQDGCDNFCTYCIIPYVRGRMRSKPKDKVIEEAIKITNMGYKEIVLAGIHTGGYGVDFDNYSFSDLVSDILNNVPLLERLRISSIEINQIDDKLLDILKNNSKLVNHFHLPVQSGSNAILKRMNRKYQKEDFLAHVNKIRSISNDISITTDIIVGFPGETEEEFNEAMNFVKEVRFSELHVFPYSKRNGTPAAKMKQVHDATKKERVTKMIELSDTLALEYAKKFEGKVLDLIPETYENGKLIGHTSNYLKVEIDGCKDLIGKKVNVLIKKANYPKNIGEIV